jgi:bacteriocin biosynthesis cyclodehydratase domain-containing protein
MTSVCIMSAGQFGKAVTRHLQKLRDGVYERDVGHASNRAAWPSADVLAIASWRPAIRECEYLDDLSHATKRPFVPLTVNSGAMYLGPVVIPGSGACWSCWIKRYLQHNPKPHRVSALWKYYDENPTVGPKGYLEPFALAGAALLSQVIDELDIASGVHDRSAVAGTIWRLDMTNLQMRSARVVGVNNCPRCGLRRELTTQSYADMRKELASCGLIPTQLAK